MSVLVTAPADAVPAMHTTLKSIMNVKTSAVIFVTLCVFVILDPPFFQ